MLRPMVVGVVFVAVIGSVVVGQGQRQPAALDDLLNEVRGLRAELNQAAGASLRAQLLTARLSLQEGRIGALSQQLASVRQQISETQMALAPFEAQMKTFQGDEPPEPLRTMLEQMQKRQQALRGQKNELTAVIVSEQGRWSEFNSRLDELERALPNGR
jgi:chromosome segregation ATPase